MKIEIEGDAVQDAVRDLLRVRDRLTHRHGAAFRGLERRIEAIAESKPAFQTHILDGGTIMVLPPRDWVDILTEAKALGVV